MATTYATQTDTVAAESIAYTAMKADYWETIEALRSGTQGMRDAGQTFLPLHSKEETPQWNYRRDRSFLFPAYDQALKNLAAKPFQKPTTVDESLPESMWPIVEDVDLNGRDATTFAHEVFEAGWDYGLTHILVDYPATGGGQTHEDETRGEIRPRFVHYRAPALFAWNTSQTVGGRTVLNEVRFKETRTERDGEYAEKERAYIRRIFRPTDGNGFVWELYGETDGQWVLEDTGPYTLPEIALVTFYVQRTGFLTAMPPMFGLADLNVQHWQVASDYGNILHVNMVPQMATSLTAEQLHTVTMGPNRVTCLGDTEAWIKFIEHSGASLNAGREELDRIEGRMKLLAQEPYLTAAPGTATGRAIDESKSQATIYRSVRALENALEECFRFAGQWMKTELPDDFAVDVYSDFVASLGGGDSAEITTDWQAGLITHATALKEKQRRGVYTDSMDVDLEAEQASQEHETQPVVELPEMEPAMAGDQGDDSG